MARKLNTLAGQLLIAMPDLKDPRFNKTLVYLIEHNEKGSMGIVINKDLGAISSKDLIKQMNLTMETLDKMIHVNFGGPVDSDRGFILHSDEKKYKVSTKLPNSPHLLTTTTDVIIDIILDQPPKQYIFALGYAGWTAGQLEKELSQNAWLHVEPDEDILFCDDQEAAWKLALKKIGVSVEALQSGFGTA